MTPIRVSDPEDARLVPFVQVTNPDWLAQQGIFVAEGRLVVQRLLEHPTLRVKSLLVSEAALEALRTALTGRTDAVEIYLCENPFFRLITGFSMHQGCLALAERPGTDATPQLMATGRRLVVLEDIGNADNVGGIFRNASAFGADGLLLSPRCCDPFYRKAIRTSMGAVLRLPFGWPSDWPAGLDALRGAGTTILALTPEPRADRPAVDIATIDPTSFDRIALLLGHEGMGLSDAAVARSDQLVRIPMSPQHDSLNVATASGIAMHRLFGGAAPRPFAGVGPLA